MLKSEGIDNFSEYWQDQCWQLYDSICMGIRDGKIEPLKLKRPERDNKESERDGTDLTTIFSTLVVFGVTGKVFVDIILDAMKVWLEYRPTADIELECPDGSTIKISKLPLAKLSLIFEENSQISICEGLNRFKNSKK